MLLASRCNKLEKTVMRPRTSQIPGNRSLVTSIRASGRLCMLQNVETSKSALPLSRCTRRTALVASKSAS